jgi:hypothetical protein
MSTQVATTNEQLRRWSSALGFCLMLPGFYVYNYLQTLGFSGVLGGYVVLISLLTSVLMAPAYLMTCRPRGITVAVDLTFWITLGFAAVWIAFSSVYVTAPEVSHGYLGASFVWVALYTFAYATDFQSRFIRILSLVTLVMMQLIIFTNVRFGVFYLEVPDLEASHQFFALIYMITLYIALANLRSVVVVWAAILTSVVALIFVGARSELIGLIFGAAIMINLRFPSALNLAFQGVVVFIGLSTVGVILTLEGNRIADFITTGGIGSRSEREWAHDNAFAVISANPLTGSYADYPPGLYSHDILSVYVDFGLAGLVLYLVLLLGTCLAMLYHVRKHGQLRDAAMAMALVLQLALLLPLAKSATYYLIPFTLGYTCSLIRQISAEARSVPGALVQSETALLRKSDEGQTFPYLEQTHPTDSVTGMPRGV